METGLRPTWPGAGQQMPGHTHAGPQLSPVRGREDTSSTQGPTTPSPRAGRPIPPSPEGFPPCPGHPVALPTQVPSSGLPLATCGSALGQGLSPSPCPEGHPRVALTRISGPPWDPETPGAPPSEPGRVRPRAGDQPRARPGLLKPHGPAGTTSALSTDPGRLALVLAPKRSQHQPNFRSRSWGRRSPAPPPGPPRGTRRRHGRSDTGLTLLCLSERRSAARPLPASAWHGAQTYF